LEIFFSETKKKKTNTTFSKDKFLYCKFLYLGGGDRPADFRPEFLPTDVSSVFGDDFPPCAGTGGVTFLGGSDFDAGRCC